MLGNEWEWTHDILGVERPSRRSAECDIICNLTYVYNKNNRILRGGSFSDVPAIVRSAVNSGFAPSSRYAAFGFRPSRTYR
jgi:formylglycine-generating enzyme required for sulfatase activity